MSLIMKAQEKVIEHRLSKIRDKNCRESMWFYLGKVSDKSDLSFISIDENDPK